MKRPSVLVLVSLVLGAGARASAQTTVHGSLWTAESDQVGAWLGSSVASAGDVNGDGFDDVIVGAIAYDGAFTNEGLAVLYLGSREGPSKAPDWSITGGQGYANLGNAVACAGDVNGDGFDDVIVGANGYDNHIGRAYVFLGSRLGPSTTPDWTAQPGDREFGYSVASAGDVNGDGFDDVIVGASGYSGAFPYAGRVHVYLGSPAGLETSAAWIVEGAQGYASFGAAVASAGDVNGDGFDDVLVGAPFWNHGQNDEGRAFLYLGSASGLDTTPAWTTESDQNMALLGFWLGSAGDVNGDGFGDVIVSVNGYSHGESAEGAALVFHGGPGGLAATPSWSTESNQFGALAGGVSAGDLDGDGFSDVLVGYYAYDHGPADEGRVFAFRGSPAGLLTAPAASWESDQRDSMFGFALAGGGDVNGDGFDDVLVGAYRFHNGQSNEGRAFLFLGSSDRRR